MKHLLILTGLCTALAVVAAPDGHVTKFASGSTSATVYFAPGAREAQLVAADVTSDKAASVLTWRTGEQQVLLLKAAAGVTNLTVTSGTIPAATNLVSVTSAGVVTAHTSYSTTNVTNVLITLNNALGTNAAATSVFRELTTTNYEVTAFSSTNFVTITSNSVISAGSTYVLSRAPDQWVTNVLTGYTTNGATYVLVFTNAIPFTPATVSTLTSNLYILTLNAAATGNTAMVDTTNGLAIGDNLLLLPSTGGVFPLQLTGAATNYYQTLNLTAAATLSVGDQIFVLGATNTAPIGAATVRLYSDAIRILPPGVPGVLSLDGTSACSINTAIMNYGQ